MALQRPVLDRLMGDRQDLVLLMQNSSALVQIEADSEELTQRWDNLLQRLEDCSEQVGTVETHIHTHTHTHTHTTSHLCIHTGI